MGKPSRRPVIEVARLFLRLGTTAFGGPAAHIALMQAEVVERRRWLDRQRFLDLMGATNLLPGPNSTEMAIHVGLVRAGWPGLIVAGVCFIVPAALLVAGLAWAYVRYGSTPTGEALLYGIEPAVIAVVAHALLRLGRTAIKDWFLASVGTGALAAYLLGMNELAVLFGGAFIVMVVRNAHRMATASGALGAWLPAVPLAVEAASRSPVDSTRLFLVFLKVGALLYGSGYVLLAFLRNDLVHGLGWLSEQQLVDAVAAGQMTPGPVFTTATFVGYVVDGARGAIVATVGIFLPAFVFVAALRPILARARRSRWTGAALDGVNVAALGLMAGVTWQLGLEAIVDVPTIAIAVAALVALHAFRLNGALVVVLGGAAGYAVRVLAG